MNSGLRYTDIWFGSTRVSEVLNVPNDPNTNNVVVIVPGIFGDRDDTRSLFSKMAAKLSEEGVKTIRFDFPGSGMSDGSYGGNTWRVFCECLRTILDVEQTSQKGNARFILISFSEGSKFSYFAAKGRSDVDALIHCNGLLVKEESMNNINRPSVISDQLVYDSQFGEWVNWDIPESYSKFFWGTDKYDMDLLKKSYAVYSDADDLSKNSRRFALKKFKVVKVIHGADHLFTTVSWVNELIETVKVLVKTVSHKVDDQNAHIPEQFKVIDPNGDRIFTEAYEANSIKAKKTVLFVPGCFETKAGPGFLFSDIRRRIDDRSNVMMFDFIGTGESDKPFDGTGELSLGDYLAQLKSVVDYTLARFSSTQLTVVGVGTGNILVDLLNSPSNLAKIFICPDFIDISAIADNLSPGKHDTSSLFQAYPKISNEFQKMGNVPNRSRGCWITQEFMKEISNYSSSFKEKKTIGWTRNGKTTKYLDGDPKDNKGLFMSAAHRDKFIEEFQAEVFGQGQMGEV